MFSQVLEMPKVSQVQLRQPGLGGLPTDSRGSCRMREGPKPPPETLPEVQVEPQSKKGSMWENGLWDKTSLQSGQVVLGESFPLESVVTLEPKLFLRAGQNEMTNF